MTAGGVQPDAKREGWFAFLPIPFVLAMIPVLSGVEPSSAYDNPYLLLGLNFIFTTLVSLFIAQQIARSFISQGSPGLLLLGTGVVFWGISSTIGTMTSLLTGSASPSAVNTSVTIHNCCAWVSAMCHVVAAALSVRRNEPLRFRRTWLAGAYSGAAVVTALIVAETVRHGFPAFFEAGLGGTLVRQFVLGSTIAMLTIAAILLRQSNIQRLSSFGHWYSFALLLFAVGLFSVWFQRANGTPLSWLGRITQYLGDIYMLVAAILAARGPHGGRITLDEPLAEVPRAYAVAISLAVGSVCFAATVRLMFLGSLGTGAPYITFFPAVMLSAVFGGFEAGLMATVLSALLADYFWIEPVGQIALSDSRHLLSLLLFVGNGLVISLLARAWRRSQTRALTAEAEARFVAEREKTAQVLRETEADLREASRMAGLGFWKWDLRSKSHVWSEEIYHTLGRDLTLPPAVYPGLQEYFSPESWGRLVAKVEECLTYGTAYELDAEVVRPDGARRWVTMRGKGFRDADGAIHELRGMVQDVTERKQAEFVRASLEDRLRQSHAVEAMGRMAGRIAHEMNNVLQPIMSHTSLAVHASREDEVVNTHLAKIKESVRHGREIIRSMLAVAKGHSSAHQSCVLEDEVAQVMGLIEATVRPNIQVETRLTPTGGRVSLSSTELLQILDNLLTNAVDAIVTAGHIQVVAGRITLDDYEAAIMGVHPGPHAELTISDSGSGMEDDILQHIFDPFFTTKAVYMGTGLGLSTVRAIVESNSGGIRITSSPSRGTVVRVVFPILQ